MSEIRKMSATQLIESSGSKSLTAGRPFCVRTFTQEGAMKRFYKVEAVSAGGSYLETESGLANIMDMLKESPSGDGYKITVVYMTHAEYESIPEFTGF